MCRVPENIFFIIIVNGYGWTRLQTSFTSTPIIFPQMGMTLSAYILSLRLEEAAKLLTQTDLTMKEIARQLSFCDVQHFSKAFQKKYAMRPLAYRQAYQARSSDEAVE